MASTSQASSVAVRSKPAQAAAKPARAGSSGVPAGRVASIDALRGFDMFWIVGGKQVVVALAVLAVASLKAVRLDITPYFPAPNGSTTRWNTRGGKDSHPGT